MNENSDYFPNQSSSSISLEESFRQIVQKCGEIERYELYKWLSSANEPYEYFEYTFNDNGFIEIRQDNNTFCFPRPVPLIIMSHILFGYKEWLLRKYSLPNFVEVQRGDVVIDCGGFIGGFSLGAVEKASKVFIFEPDLLNFESCKRNFSSTVNCFPVNAALYSHTTKLSFNISPNSVEHSLLLPDDGNIKNKRLIDVMSLNDFCSRNNINIIDFLKIEAEGAEIEVFEGLGDFRPRKIAIDISPERNHESPYGYFVGALTEKGYTIKRRKNVLFARLIESE